MLKTPFFYAGKKCCVLCFTSQSAGCSNNDQKEKKRKRSLQLLSFSRLSSLFSLVSLSLHFFFILERVCVRLNKISRSKLPRFSFGRVVVVAPSSSFKMSGDVFSLLRRGVFCIHRHQPPKASSPAMTPPAVGHFYRRRRGFATRTLSCGGMENAFTATTRATRARPSLVSLPSLRAFGRSSFFSSSSSSSSSFRAVKFVANAAATGSSSSSSSSSAGREGDFEKKKTKKKTTGSSSSSSSSSRERVEASRRQSEKTVPTIKAMTGRRR